MHRRLNHPRIWAIEPEQKENNKKKGDKQKLELRKERKTTTKKRYLISHLCCPPSILFCFLFEKLKLFWFFEKLCIIPVIIIAWLIVFSPQRLLQPIR